MYKMPTKVLDTLIEYTEYTKNLLEFLDAPFLEIFNEILGDLDWSTLNSQTYTIVSQISKHMMFIQTNPAMNVK